jgi:hypothetical protein
MNWDANPRCAYNQVGLKGGFCPGAAIRWRARQSLLLSLPALRPTDMKQGDIYRLALLASHIVFSTA